MCFRIFRIVFPLSPFFSTFYARDPAIMPHFFSKMYQRIFVYITRMADRRTRTERPLTYVRARVPRREISGRFSHLGEARFAVIAVRVFVNGEQRGIPGT